jgi:hypothetical protein
MRNVGLPILILILLHSWFLIFSAQFHSARPAQRVEWNSSLTSSFSRALPNGTGQGGQTDKVIWIATQIHLHP